ncbi:MAG TPA: SAM-dependent methyltransferase [Clostridia bacterium]|jgi:hypothetical protein|nr:MAG: hypothetical protein BWX97_01282 [Firmicutes bacterium ADurb.Bin146]HOD93795.1 SAM-dependent methyltransferase [Clostridia bacterium]
MNKELLYEQWKKEEKTLFTGWDFSHISSAYECFDTPWDYESIVKIFLKEDMMLLDMGTADGKVLLKFNHPFNKTWVTECYPLNVEIVKTKLIPLGIRLCEVDNDNNLLLDSCYFDIVINRHESYNPNEVFRILKNNSIFITQQVGGDNNISLSSKLIEGYKPAYPDHTLDNEKDKLLGAGFKIIYSSEVVLPSIFYSVKAIIYYAKAVEWEFPGFSVDKSLDKLFMLQEEIEEHGYVSSNESRFIIVAIKSE